MVTCVASALIKLALIMPGDLYAFKLPIKANIKRHVVCLSAQKRLFARMSQIAQCKHVTCVLVVTVLAVGSCMLDRSVVVQHSDEGLMQLGNC